VQFVIDPVVLKFNKEIAARREQVKQLIDARTKAGGESSTDVFTVVFEIFGRGRGCAL